MFLKENFVRAEEEKAMKKLESENNLVVRANQLIEAKYRLTATEQKIIYVLTSMIHKDDEDFKPYNIMINDLMTLIDTDSHSKYTEVKTVSRNLMKKVFTIHDTEKDEEIQVAWFSSVNYKHKKGIVEFEFSPYLKPLMLQLKSHFTKFKLDNVMQLRSGYSLRLYELLKQYEKIGRRQFDVSKLRELIGISQKEYSLYADFKKRVLIQAQKEINSRTDITFDFKEIKEGKKIIAIEFKILPVIVIEPSPQLTLPEPKNEINKDTDIQAIKDKFKRLYNIDLPNSVAKELLDKKGFEYVLNCVNDFKDHIKGKEIKNMIGFFKSVVIKGYDKPASHDGTPRLHPVHVTPPEERERQAKISRGEPVAPICNPEVAKEHIKKMRDIVTGKITADS